MRWFKQMTRTLRARRSRRLLAGYGRAVLTGTPHGLLLVDPDDFSVGRSLLRRGGYNVHEVRFLQLLVRPEWVAVFVGAHIGTYLIPLAGRVQTVTGYEPHPRLFELLTYNCRLNEVTNAHLFNTAVGNTAGRVALQYSALDTAHCRIDPAATDDNAGRGPVADVMVFDDHAGNGDRRYDLLVMDIEGAECRALVGMPRTLASLGHLFIEFSPDMLRDYGADAAQFAALLQPHFPCMAYVWGDRLRQYRNTAWVPALVELAEHRPLINLLFSKMPVPDDCLQCWHEGSQAIMQIH